MAACESNQDRPPPYQSLFRTAESTETEEEEPDDDWMQVPRDQYPAGPYGLEAGDVLADYELEGVDGPITMSALRSDASRRVLWIVIGAPWCPFCRREVPHLLDEYAARHDDGLEILGVAESDASGRVPDADDAVETFEAPPYPVAADTRESDPSLVLDGFAAGIDTIPANLLVDLDTMRISLRQTGFDRSRMDTFLDIFLLF